MFTILSTLTFIFVVCLAFLSWSISQWPKISYLNYRFSGFLSLIGMGGLGFIISPIYQTQSFELQHPHWLILFLGITSLYLFIWLAKVNLLCWLYKSQLSWLYFISFPLLVMSVIFFPLGLLSYVFHERFIIRRVHLDPLGYQQLRNTPSAMASGKFTSKFG
ncbi:hypothetical protein SAMN05421831_10199 [Allopseudospirillum japonicum]|uniref:Uncharacterized protein n=1 Tax=Allopseudospirillum japonicum TaxID=64971 RepID=A0A1H6QFU7_9GAMM|nr:hypothetical protein [Allopseudospirillum japonicum]SEI37842.1 hypothetical protein SAMN05421831_10199 [Allopseudospirillum japonicum]